MGVASSCDEAQDDLGDVFGGASGTPSKRILVVGAGDIETKPLDRLSDSPATAAYGNM